MKLAPLQRRRAAEAAEALAAAEKRLRAARKRVGKLRRTVAYYADIRRQPADPVLRQAATIVKATTRRPDNPELLAVFAEALAADGQELETA